MSETTKTASEAKHDAGAPLAWGLHGDRLEVPDAAVGWRVKRLSSSGRAGAPEVVYSNGIPLFLPITAGVQDLSEAVDGIAGKYRLDLVDDFCKAIPDAPAAYVVLGGSAAANSAEPMVRVLDCVERLARVNAEAMEKLSSQLSAIVDASSRLVNAADSAGVTRRELAVLPAAVAVETPQPEVENKVVAVLSPVVAALEPYIPNLMNGLAAWLISKAMPGAPAMPIEGGTP